MVPSDAGSNAQEATELFFITTDTTSDISRLDHPRFIEAIEQEILTLFSFLQRKGQTTPVKAGEKSGALMTWEGTNPTGMQINARLFVTLFNQNSIGLFAVGGK